MHRGGTRKQRLTLCNDSYHFQGNKSQKSQLPESSANNKLVSGNQMLNLSLLRIVWIKYLTSISSTEWSEWRWLAFIGKDPFGWIGGCGSKLPPSPKRLQRLAWSLISFGKKKEKETRSSSGATDGYKNRLSWRSWRICDFIKSMLIWITSYSHVTLQIFHDHRIKHAVCSV